MATLAGAYREQRRHLVFRYLLFLGSLWVVVFAFALNELSLLTGRPRLFLLAALINSLGNIAFIVVAPLFYHAVLETPMTPWTRRFYLAFDIIVLLFVLGLAWERYRGLAVIVLHSLLFAMVLYGALLGALRYRHLREASLRRVVRVFVVLSLVCLTPIYWEGRPEEIAPLVRNDWLDGVALPGYYLIICVLSVAFVLRGGMRARRARARNPHRPPDGRFSRS